MALVVVVVASSGGWLLVGCGRRWLVRWRVGRVCGGMGSTTLEVCTDVTFFSTARVAVLLGGEALQQS